MHCPKCQHAELIVESVSEHSKLVRAKCLKCGFNEIRDQFGKKLLTEGPQPSKLFG